MKKNIIIIFLLLSICFLPINTFGECIEGDCVNGKGTFAFPDGGKYVGEWKDGQRHGKGTSTFPGGSKYVGEFEDGKRHGPGTLTYSNGEKCVGEWKDGKFYKKKPCR
jgi:hypothetical protein